MCVGIRVTQSFKGLWRNGVMSLASILVLMSCLVVIGGFALLVHNININLADFGLDNQIVVYLAFDLEEEEIVATGAKLEVLDNVESVKRTTKSEALQMMKNEFKSYPDGYQKLMKKLVPWFFGPMREKMMRLLLTILTDG